MALTRHTGGGVGAGGGANEAHGAGGLALTRRTGGGGGGANEARGGGGGWLAVTRRTGGGGVALTRRAPSPICASYNEAPSFGQTLNPRYSPCFVLGCLVHIAQILGLFGAFWGRFSDKPWS